ncbi:MAG: hypothetical protein MJZ46_00100 [Bacteroidales bacterium]|nr:hypothetical protein [Bacteroidales bacterium]
MATDHTHIKAAAQHKRLMYVWDAAVRQGMGNEQNFLCGTMYAATPQRCYLFLLTVAATS